MHLILKLSNSFISMTPKLKKYPHQLESFEVFPFVLHTTNTDKSAFSSKNVALISFNHLDCDRLHNIKSNSISKTNFTHYAYYFPPSKASVTAFKGHIFHVSMCGGKITPLNLTD